MRRRTYDPCEHGRNQIETKVENGNLVRAPGDVLFSYARIPYPGRILTGFKKVKYGPRFDPYVNFAALGSFLEFLEFVVLTERLIVPQPEFSKGTARIVNGRKTWVDFAVFHATGDLDYKTDEVVERLEKAGVLFPARVTVGDETADDVVAKAIPSSKYLQAQWGRYLGRAQEMGAGDPFSVARAHLAVWVGGPLHVARAASLSNVPYVLSQREEDALRPFEAENLRARRAVGAVLLDRLNAAAKKELAQLTDLGVMSIFPETPIASLIVQNAASPRGMVEAALELRSEFAGYRRHMNQIEQDLVDENQPLAIRLKRMRELQQLADSLWRNAPTDTRTTAVGVSDALSAIPGVIADPSATSAANLLKKIAALPVDRLLDIFRTRKIRLLLKAKKSFLKSSDSTAKIASIFNVPIDIARQSRLQSRPSLNAQYAAKNPEVAERWLNNDW